MSDDFFPERGERRSGLHDLPEFAADPALWSRIVEARSQAAARRWRLRAFGAAAAAVVATLALGWPRPGPDVRYSTAPEIESRALENEWRDLAGVDSQASGGFHRLRFIDASLQSAYDRGAAPDELAPLWRQRNEALKNLIWQFRNAGDRSADAITRI